MPDRVKEIALKLEQKHGKENIGKTATTGLASTHIEGITVHSWAGIGIG